MDGTLLPACPRTTGNNASRRVPYRRDIRVTANRTTVDGVRYATNATVPTGAAVTVRTPSSSTSRRCHAERRIRARHQRESASCTGAPNISCVQRDRLDQQIWGPPSAGSWGQSRAPCGWCGSRLTVAGCTREQSASVTTENVTVLFTDMVGSTALASSLAPDAADELRRGHFSILRQAVAEAGGTEVKNLGDGLMVVFGAASAALSCAVAMQQGIERDNRGREHSVGLRVGLSGGEVSREDDDYFGDPVIEAARLCARCESGQVLAADIVRLTAGRRSRHECRSLGRAHPEGSARSGGDRRGAVGTARRGRHRDRHPASWASRQSVLRRVSWAGKPRWRRCRMRSSVSPGAKAARCS